VADFDVWHNARAVLDNGTVLEIDNLHTVVGVTHISRGLANMEEEGFAGMSGFPPAEAHVYLALAMVAGAGFMTWENGNADSLEVALAPGQTFELASGKSFDVSATAATGTVFDTGLDVAMDAGRGVKFEYMILSDPCGPCKCMSLPEGSVSIVVTNIEPLSGFLVGSDSGFVTILSQFGMNVVDSLEEYPITNTGGYCVYASDSSGVPSGVITSFTAGGVLASSFDTPLAQDIENVTFDADGIMGTDPALLVGPFVLPSSPAIQVFGLDYPVVGAVDLSAAGPSLERVTVNCSSGLADGFVDNIILPAVHVIDYLQFNYCILPEAVVDTLANALSAAIPNGEVNELGTGSSAPSAASQVNRQALYDAGWTLPASWLTDLTP
jgi:hypothetical protein